MSSILVNIPDSWGLIGQSFAVYIQTMQTKQYRIIKEMSNSLQSVEPPKKQHKSPLEWCLHPNHAAA